MMMNSDALTNITSVEVNLVGVRLDPDRVTTILGLEPSGAARSGEPCSRKDPMKLRDEGYWAHEISAGDELTECRDHGINCLADSLLPHRDTLRDAGVERIYFYYTLSSFIGMLNVRLKSETMRKLSELEADIYVSCFDCFDPNHEFFNLGTQGDNGSPQ